MTDLRTRLAGVVWAAVAATVLALAGLIWVVVADYTFTGAGLYTGFALLLVGLIAAVLSLRER